MSKCLIYLQSIISIILFVFSACQTNSDKNNSNIIENKLSQMEWQLGNWANEQDNGRFTETWTKKDDSTYLAESYFTKEKDTLFAEKVTLQFTDGELYYMVKALNQNNDEVVSFKLVTDSANVFVFENKMHDFPKQIIYKQVNSDSLYARIEGYQNGKLRFEEFPMKRIKN